MKRILALFFALVLLLPSLAFADVIVEPDNGFYRTHQDECRHQEGRTYLADGPDGKLDLYTAPNGVVADTVGNGTALYCQWIYTDKQEIVWGFSERIQAWFPLGYTKIQYDHATFEVEHMDEIETPSGFVERDYETVYLYEYPGAPDPIQLDQVGLMAEKVYTDSEGRQWGFVSYIYGIRSRWFCLDEPGNGQLSEGKKEAVPSGFAAPEKLPAASRTGIVAAVVGAVALLTLLVVLLLFRRKQKA